MDGSGSGSLGLGKKWASKEMVIREGNCNDPSVSCMRNGKIEIGFII